MYQISDETVVSMIESYCRTWRMLIYDRTTGRTFTGERCMNASSDIQTTTDSENVEFGAVCSGQWTVTVYNPNGLTFLGDRMDLSLFLMSPGASSGPPTWESFPDTAWDDLSGLTWAQLADLRAMIGDPIPMGRNMVCIKVRNSGFTSELTICDRLCLADKPYVSQLTFPTSSQNVEQEILYKLHLSSNLDYYTDYSLTSAETDGAHKLLTTSDGKRLTVEQYGFTIRRADIPEGATMREMLGWIASVQGQFGYVDRLGRYTRKWYSAPVKTLDNNTIDLPTLSEDENRITGLVCDKGDGSDPFEASWGKGRTVTFTNPFMTSTLFSSLVRRLQREDYRWYTAEVRHILGDPRFDPGDTLTYRDKSGKSFSFPITSLAFGFDGGLWADIRAAGMTFEQEADI